jgi:hypothetical protein
VEHFDGFAVRRRIGKVQVAKLDVAENFRLGGERYGGAVVDAGLGSEDLVDADDGCGSALEEIDHVAQGDDGPHEHVHIRIERNELADRNAVSQHLMPTDKQRDDHGHTKHEFERRPEHAHEADQT